MITPNDLTHLTDEQRQRRLALTGILEFTVRFLELTPEQRTSAHAEYVECGLHLTKALGFAQDKGDIFPQGSMRLGTAIRPFRDITEVFDLDLIFRIVGPCSLYDPKRLREEVGKHLSSKYGSRVKPPAKGWCLDFSKERDYHLDVIPAMDSACGGGVIAITDKLGWQDSHPRGYAEWFERHTAILPTYRSDAMIKEGMVICNASNIEPLPEHTNFKSPLQRITQIAKRHRDYHFNKKTGTPELLTASIIITTLLTKAYAARVPGRVFESDFDVLLACAEDMDNHLEVRIENGIAIAWLPNPSLPKENLVSKWSDERFSKAFFGWHREFTGFLRGLLSGGGAERRLLTEAMGESAVKKAFAKQAETIRAARDRNVLTVRSGTGLMIGATLPVPKHSSHGRA